MIKVINGDALEELKKLPDNSVDAVVCDPPYGLSNIKPDKMIKALSEWVSGNDTVVPETRGFMGHSWDAFVPPPAVWKECIRVLKPGGHMAVFAGTRTQDLMGLSIRLAGFEIKDTLGWIHGSGFPKGQNIGKQIEKKLEDKQKYLQRVNPTGKETETYKTDTENNTATTPSTNEARKWNGWNTHLKPAIEPIILAQKPLDGTVVNNVLKHGVGGLNIDACRVHSKDAPEGRTRHGGGIPGNGSSYELPDARPSSPAGRFPANVLLDEHAAKEIDKQSGYSVSTANNRGMQTSGQHGGLAGNKANLKPGTDSIRGHNDSGGASRFFPVFKYQAKAPKKERPVIERPPMLQLRDDLTPEQVDHVRERLREVGIEIE